MNGLATTANPVSVQYTLLNFHPLERNGLVSGWLQDRACRPLVLRGENGSGRTYLLQAACQTNTLDGMPFRLAVLDWAELFSVPSPQDYFQKLLQQALPENEQGRTEWSKLAGEIFDAMKQRENVAVMLLGAVLKFAADQKLHERIIGRFREQKARLTPSRWQDAFRVMLEDLGAGQHLVLLLRNADHFPQQGSASPEEKTNTLWHYYDTCFHLDKAYWQQAPQDRRHGRMLFACTVNQSTPASALQDLPGIEELAVTPINEEALKTLVGQRFNPNRFGLRKNLLGGHALNRNFVRLLYDYARLEQDGKTCHPPLLAETCAELLGKGILQEGKGGWQLAPETPTASLESLLGQPLRLLYRDALLAVPQSERDPADKFMRLAGLFDPLIPWNLLLQYLHEVEKTDTVRLEASLREHFMDSTGLLEWVMDDVPHLPESQGVSYACFRNPLLAASLRPSETRSQWVKDLLRKLQNYSAPNRSTAQLFLHLAAQAGDSGYQSMSAELAWWLDEQYASVYETLADTQLQSGLVKTGDLVNLLMRNQGWPMHRRRAILNACKRYYTRQGNIPSLAEARHYWYLTGKLEDHAGNYSAAVVAFQQQLTVEQRLFTPDSSEIATTLNNLASLYQAQGDTAQALPLYERSLAILEKVLGAEHPDVAASLNNLASLYQAQGDTAQALPLYERSLAIREKVLGAEHPDVALSLNNLASLYQAQGDTAQALPLCERSLAIREKVLGAEHPDVAASLNNLALLYQAQGDTAQALPLYERSLAIREKVLGAEHPKVALSLNNLASLYQAQGDTAQALPLYERSLAILEKVLGAEHPDVATSLNNLALLYQAQGDTAQALPLYERTIRIAEKKLGLEHPSTRLYRGNYEKCREEMAQANLPPSSPESQ